MLENIEVFNFLVGWRVRDMLKCEIVSQVKIFLLNVLFGDFEHTELLVCFHQ